jgi:hypothetical protein
MNPIMRTSLQTLEPGSGTAPRTASGAKAQPRAGFSPLRTRGVWATVVACAVLLTWGWSVREELYVSPEFGVGYALGIVGLGAMVLLLGYSLRKRVTLLRRAGLLRRWFGVHMVLGLVGPVAILFHANFQPGSLNSVVALTCMLAVAGSGLVGRLIYPKIHDGLSGRRATLGELRADAASRRGALGRACSASPAFEKRLATLESTLLTPAGGAAAAIWRFVTLGSRTRAARRELLALLRRLPSALAAPGAGPSRQARREAERAVRAYVKAVRHVASFGAYERLFSLWHAAHLPLCVLLFGAAAVHVIAVHLY